MTTAPRCDAGDSGSPDLSAWRQRLLAASAWAAFGVFAVWFAASLIPNLVLRLRFEDQLIVLRYARNLAEGNGLVYNVGEQVMGFTTPLFTVLSSVFVVLGGDQAAAWQNGFGLLCMLGTAALSARLLVHLGAGVAAPLAAALVTFNPAVAYNYLYVGMEIHLFALLFLLALDLHLRERATAAAVASALLFLTRPEGALLAGMLLAHRWLHRRQLPVAQALAALATALPWLLFALLYYGDVLPKTLGAKQGESIISPWRYLDMVREVYADAGNSLLAAWSHSLAETIAGSLLLVALLIVGAAALLRRRPVLWPLIAFPFCSLLGYAAIGSLPGYTWHYYTLNVLGAFLLALGIHAALVGTGRLCLQAAELLPSTARIAPRQRRLVTVLATAVPILVLTLPVLRDTSRQIGHRVEPSAREQRLEDIGRWLAERYEPSTSVLVREIGHVGWVSGLRIVDRGGLVTPGLRYDVPRRVAAMKFLPDLLLLRADNYGIRDPREGAGFPSNLGYERVEEFDHGQEWSLHSLIERGSSSRPEADRAWYDVARSAAGHLEAVLRYRSGDGESRAPNRIPIAQPPSSFEGALDAVLPRPDPEPTAGMADFVVSGFIRDDPPDLRGVEAVLLFIGGEMTVYQPGVHRRPDLAALYGPPFENGGFAFRAPADRDLVEREGVLAYALSRRGVASRLRFTYLPLEWEPGDRQILPTTDGRRLAVRPPGDGYDGELDLLVSGNRVEIEGWAVDSTRGERPRQIVIYRDGHFLTNLGLNRERPDIAERFGNPALLRAGFRGAVPGEGDADSFGERHRVFAIMLRGAAVELSPRVPDAQDGGLDTRGDRRSGSGDQQLGELAPSQPVAQIPRVGNVPDRDVGPLPRLQRAAILKSQRLRGMPGDTCQALFRRQTEQTAGQGHRFRQGAQRRRARITVRGDRDRHAVPAQLADRRATGRVEGQAGARQQHGDRPGPRQRLHAVRRRVLEMVRRKRSETGSHLGAAAIAQLVRMQLDRQAEIDRALEDPGDLGGVECDPLAEAVHGIGEVSLHRSGHHVRQNQIDVGVRPPPKLGRHRVRGKKRGPDRQAGMPAETPGNLQHPEFRVRIEAIAGLDLDRGRAFGGEGPQSMERGVVELVLRRRPGRADSRHDAAAGIGDVLVARSAEACLELRPPISSEDQVGVAIDEAGSDPSAIQGALLSGLARRQPGTRTDPGDRPAGDRQRAVLDRPVGDDTVTHRRDARVGQQQVPTVHRNRSCPVVHAIARRHRQAVA